MQAVCGLDCAKSLALSVRLKEEKRQAIKEKREDRARKEKLKTRSDYMKEAQREFNRYIRFRDAGKPCICCGNPLGDGLVGGGYDCGHYRSVGSAPHLRFDERNAHAQTKRCNRYGAGRAVDYRRGLIERCGLAFVEGLEADQTPKHYSIDDLKAIKKLYAAKTRELLKARDE
jgi:FtsZ-binding cell division protein ZapB